MYLVIILESGGNGFRPRLKEGHMAHHYTFSVVKHPQRKTWGILATCSECGPQEIVEIYDSPEAAYLDLDNQVASFETLYGDEDVTFRADRSPVKVFPHTAVI